MEITVIVCLGVLAFCVVVLTVGVLAATRVSNQHTAELLRGLLAEIQEAREAAERTTEMVIDPGAIHSHIRERAETKTQTLPAQVKMWIPPPEAFEPPEVGPADEQFTVSRS